MSPAASLPTEFLLSAAVLFGSLFGSFLNVVIHRLPRRESIVFPPSRCTSCRARIAPWDNIPVLSWLILGGKCRSCRAPISVRYPLVEMAAALLTGLVVWKYGLSMAAVAFTWFCLSLLAITLIDLEHRIIPDAISLPGTILGFLFVRWTEVTWIEAAVGAAAGFGLLLLVGIVYEKVTGVEGMGGGDIKMAAMMGAFLGWKGVLLTIFIGSFLGSVAGVIAMSKGKGGRTALPFGTFLAPGATIVLFVGNALIDWYLSLIVH